MQRRRVSRRRPSRAEAVSGADLPSVGVLQVLLPGFGAEGENVAGGWELMRVSTSRSGPHARARSGPPGSPLRHRVLPGLREDCAEVVGHDGGASVPHCARYTALEPEVFLNLLVGRSSRLGEESGEAAPGATSWLRTSRDSPASSAGSSAPPSSASRPRRSAAPAGRAASAATSISAISGTRDPRFTKACLASQ